MLTIDPEKVCRIIERARGASAAESGNDPARRRLAALIGALDENELAELTALSWLGRGTYEFGEWAEALQEAHAALSERTADYLAALPLLGDCLEKGLAAFGRSRGDARHN